MLDRIFISVLNMSLIASYVILFVLIARLFLKKAPKIFSYALWAVVLVRLLCPFSFESAIGLLPNNTEPIPQDIVYQAIPQIDTGIHIIDRPVNHILPPAVTTHVTSINPLQIWTFIASQIWLIGIAVVVAYSVISLIKLRRKLIGATPLEKNIYIADHIDSPFVMGFIKPKIYLPSNLTDTEYACILCHEQTHIKRLDHITRILAFLALTIHWFNPLVWIAFMLSNKDMEISCDESVMKNMNTDIRADYSEALLKFATGKKWVTTTPLAFGEGDTKDRVKNVMKYKKPVIWTSAIAFILVMIISIGFLANQNDTISIFDAEGKLPYTLSLDSDFRAFWMDNSVKPSLSHIIETPMVDMFEFFSTHTEMSNTAILHENRTKYLTDNSAVIDICTNLPLPMDARYESVQIHSEGDNGLTVYLRGNSKKYHEEAGANHIFSQNAVLLFSLIENLHHVTFVLNPEESQYGGFIYTKENAENCYGDLFPQTESIEGLNELMTQVFGTQDGIDLSNLSDIPADFGDFDINKIEILLSNGNPAYGYEWKMITDPKEIESFMDIFEHAKINDEIAIDIGIVEPSYYRFYQGGNLVKKYQFNGNDTSAIWTGRGYDLIEYIDETPYEIYVKSNAVSMIYYGNSNFTHAVDISKEYIKNDEDSGIIDYDRPMVELKVFPEGHTIFDVDINETLDIGGKDVYIISYETTADELVGPIRFFVDAKTMEPLGFAPRR